MRGQAPPRRYAARTSDPQAGLSLVEVLVTLSVTALASALIVTTARPADPLKQEAQRLERTLEQLEARAQLSGVPTALLVRGNAYAPAVWAGDEWLPADRERRQLGESLRLYSSREAADGAVIVFDPLFPAPGPSLVLRSRDREIPVQRAH